MASLGGEQQISTNSQPDEPVGRTENREGSMERRVSKDRDEKLKIARERQNEERQRKIEELKAQAEAAQRYREQKEEERRRRIDEIRHRDSEKRLQVEERKKAIMEAEKERREYILRKNQERESRLETKKRDKNSNVFAFGSSTPRLLEPADFGMVSPSTFWGQRRSTSISNVAGASLSRRSSERELADSVYKKRATSASGTERHDDHRRKTSSMYEVFNWGYSNDEPPKRFSLSIVGSEINIDEPPTTSSRSHTVSSEHKQNSNHLTATTKYFSTNDDTVDTSQIIFRSVARRKTDLMPTIPSPREGHFGSRSSLSQTPRTPGRAYSMNRLDQLAQPIRRNGEHIRAVLERERREQMDMLDETESLGGGRRVGKKSSTGGGASNKDTMSRSMSHLAGSSAGGRKYNLGGGISSSFRPLNSGNKDSCKSMTHLTHSWSSTPPRSNLGLQTTATKKYLQSSFASSSTKRGQHFTTTNTYRYDPNSLLLMSSSFVTAGSRSGNVTPGGSISASRPGSAMSTSTNLSTSGYVNRRAVPIRKPRPASIAGTGVSLEEITKLKKENKPPVKSSSPLSAQSTPKRTSNMMSTSMIVTSSSSRLSSAEKKTPSKKDINVSKPTTPKPLSKTASSDRLNKINNKEQKPKDLSASMTKSSIVTTSTSVTTVEKTNTTSSDQAIVETAKIDIVPNDPAIPAKTKDEKNALNTVKTEDVVEKNIENPAVEEVVNITQDASIKVGVLTDEKIDQGNEKDSNESISVSKTENNNMINKNSSEVRELTPPSLAVVEGGGGDMMTASMIAKSKITTEEEAKAALAERRRLAREEAERQAELERQRIEAEHLAELKRQEEEAERQRQFEEEATRLATEQRKAEEERLRQAIEEAKQREEEERLKREDEEKQRIEREEAEKKAKEEAEKQRLEVAERLKREEKEREERRKRVEAIMSRTRKGGAPGTPNSTPVKENNENKVVSNEQNQQNAQSAPTITAIQNNSSSNDESNSTSASTTSATTPIIPPNTVAEPQNSQAMYEQSVMDKEALLMKGLSPTVIDENAKNLQQQASQQQQPQNVEITNGKLHTDFPNNDALLQNTNISSVANGNGHIENINNKNELNILQDIVAPATNQLIDLSIESQGGINNTVNFNNNNSLLSTTNTLVTADSHENTDISLL